MSISARRVGAAFAMVAAAAGPHAAIARGVAVRVAIVAPVTGAASAVMPTALWHRLVARYVGGTEVPIAGAAPTVDDCRAVGSDLLVTAPFALAPKLPGLPGSSDGRISATTHVVAISCATGAVVLDRVVPLESDPPSDEEAGDFERDPELVWDHGVAVALARDRIDNALVRRQATIALAASVADAGRTGTATSAMPPPATRERRSSGRQIPVYAPTPSVESTGAPVVASTAARIAVASSDRATHPLTAPSSAPGTTSSLTPSASSTSLPNVTRHASRTRERAATSPTAAPVRVATRDVTAAPIARLVDLIDVSRIAGVTQPFAILNVRDPSLQAGDRLVDFADASHVLRARPIELTVTENFGTYVQIVFDATGDAPVPVKGDLVQRAPSTP